MRLSMNKEDICEPIKIPKEKRNEFLSTIIKSCISNSNIIGKNLEIECINYFEQLETNRDEAIEFIKKKKLNCELYGEQTFSVDDLLSILERGKYDS